MAPFILKTSALLTTIFFASGLTCRANLGEAEAKCIARYGSESDVKTDLGYHQVGDKAATFNVHTPSGSMIVTVTFLNGLSCHESFCNADFAKGLSDEQMKAILKSQEAGFKWDKRKTVYRSAVEGDTSGTVDWLRSDGATAKFWISGKASSQSLSGQVDLSTKQYAYAQHFYEKEDGGN